MITWNTITNGKEVALNGNGNTMEYSRQLDLEKFTDYKFSTAEKTVGLTKESIRVIDENISYEVEEAKPFFNNIGQALSNSAKVGKYLPFIALVGLVIWILNKGGIIGTVRAT